MMVHGPHLTWAKGKGQAFALPGASQKSRLWPYLLLSRDKVALPQISGGSPCIQFARFCTFLENGCWKVKVQNHSYSSSTDFIGQLTAKLVGLTPHLNKCRFTFGSNKNVINSKSLSVVDPSSLWALVQFYSHSTHHNIPAPSTSIQTFAQIVISDTNTCEGGSQVVQR
jgi:hypothetical protein